MKKLIYFFFLILFLSPSCKNNTKYKDLTSTWPDVDDIFIPKDAIPDSASIIGAVRFYDSILPGRAYSRRNKDLSFQKARAYYFKALMEQTQTNQHVEAFTDYLNALWVMEGTKGEHSVISSKDYDLKYERFTALTYDRLAWFLYTYDAWGTALDCLERSSDCFKKEGNSRGVASNFELMGDVILAQGDKLQAMYYYKKSDSIHERLKTDDIYQNFSSVIHRSLDLYNANEKMASLALLHHALQENHSSWLTRQVRFALGYFYLQDHEYDSALYNYERSYPLLPRQTLKSYSRIVQIANNLGDTIKAGYYGELLADAYLQQFARSSDRAKMETMYENYLQDCANAKHKDVLFFVIFCVLLLVALIIIDSFALMRRKQRHEKEIEEREQIQASLEDEIESVKNSSQQKEEAIKALQSKLDKVISNPDFQKLPFDKKLEALYETPICKRILKVKTANVKAFSSYPELVLSDNQMTMLVNAVDAVFPKFSVRIIEMFPRLKRSDVVYCCLYILGITEVQAAALTGKTYQAVWTRSLKMHEIFNNKSNLQLVLHGYIKDW